MDSNDTDLRKARKKDRDKKWVNNPVENYFEERKSSLAESSYSQEKFRINRFFDFIEEFDQIPEEVGIKDVVMEDVYKFVENDLVPDKNITDPTIEGYLKDLNYFYKTLVAHGVIDDNPVYNPDKVEGDKGVLHEVRNSDKYDNDGNRRRPHIPSERMQIFLDWIDSKRIKAYHLTGLKTSIRTGGIINLDLRCVHISHPLYKQLLEYHGVILDDRVRNKPDSLLIYESIDEGEEIPNEDRPGPDKGEVRESSKRKEKGGSIVPIDSELKTALLEWLLTRPRTPERDYHPVFTKSDNDGSRISKPSSNYFWAKDMSDSIKRFGREQAIDKCPECGGDVIKKNPKQGSPGRHYDCLNCGERHWRSIMWEGGLATPQKVVFHCHRKYFSDGHREKKSEITENEMADFVRQYKIRGDRKPQEDADLEHYSTEDNLNWEKDVREPYLEAIYKFDLYDDPIPAVGEGWNG